MMRESSQPVDATSMPAISPPSHGRLTTTPTTPLSTISREREEQRFRIREAREQTLRHQATSAHALSASPASFLLFARLSRKKQMMARFSIFLRSLQHAAQQRTPLLALTMRDFSLISRRAPPMLNNAAATGTSSLVMTTISASPWRASFLNTRPITIFLCRCRQRRA